MKIGKLHLKSAVQSHSRFDLSCHHLTTMDFGQIVPIFVQHEIVPGDSFNIKNNVFARLAPLAVPTYGNCYFKTASFFVPYHQVAYDMEAFLAGDEYFNGKLANNRSVPYCVLLGTLLNLPKMARPETIVPSDLSSIDSKYVYIDDGSDISDLSVVYNDGSVSRFYRYRFTTLGRYYVKVLASLGYLFPTFVVGESAGSEVYTPCNLLPLLSYYKAYNDWMSQSAIYNNSRMTNILQKIRYSWDTYGNVYSDLVSDLSHLFEDTYLLYESNYFTSAWASPNEIIPNGGYNRNSLSPNRGLDVTDSALDDNKQLTTNAVTTANLSQNSIITSVPDMDQQQQKHPSASLFHYLQNASHLS